jgi:aryl-alcohol dehydrogenase-like predicted oxidoreductase
MASRGNRDEMVIATKVGKALVGPGLSGANIRARVEGSLRRLRTDRIDLYYAHRDDPEVAMEETLQAFDELVRAGKVRHIAASNFTADRLESALRVSQENGLARYAALQNDYSLMERARFEGAVQEAVVAHGLAAVPYYSLARGFLTGKYRVGAQIDSPRAVGAAAYVGERGDRVLAALTDIATRCETTPACVALAWLLSRPGVAAPIASARTVRQLGDLVGLGSVALTAADIQALDAASS